MIFFSYTFSVRTTEVTIAARRSISHTRVLCIGLELQWATKVLRHLVVKFDFWSLFAPFPPKNNVDFSISSTAQSTPPTQR